MRWPPGDFREWSREGLIRALDANMLDRHIELIKSVADPMIDNKFDREYYLWFGKISYSAIRPVKWCAFGSQFLQAWLLSGRLS